MSWRDNNINKTAAGIIQRVIEKPGTVFNPLFILGGDRKTREQLLKTLRNRIHEKHKDQSLYCGNIAPERNQKADLLKHYISQNKQIILALDMPIPMAREYISRLFPIPEKSLFLDIT